MKITFASYCLWIMTTFSSAKFQGKSNTVVLRKRYDTAHGREKGFQWERRNRLSTLR
jgi:hypothetical protein